LMIKSARKIPPQAGCARLLPADLNSASESQRALHSNWGIAHRQGRGVSWRRDAGLGRGRADQRGLNRQSHQVTRRLLVSTASGRGRVRQHGRSPSEM